MSLYVLKFGGSSVATVSRIENVSSIIRNLYQEGHELVVVVSAMQGVTNQLVDLTRNFTDTGSNRESDVVISSGEQVSSGLLALCLQKNGLASQSLQGWQIPILTDSLPGEANIKSIDTSKLKENIKKGIITVVSGFQGVSEKCEVTTIGRGGSDASAVALARFLCADECFIYTDVDGVYTADPRIVLDAKKLSCISYGEMAELAASGAKVLQNRSVQISSSQGVKLRVLSSFASDRKGTIIHNTTEYLSKVGQVAGIAHNISVFSVRSTQHLLSFLQTKNIDFIKVNEDHVLISKSHYGDIKSIYENIDSDVGLVNVVGQNIRVLEEQILREIKYVNADIKSYRILNTSLTLVMPFQYTEFIVTALHKFLF